ncbi:cyclase family protein [Paenibacillus sp. FSL H7-0331]|uniref:cyclase family protein n=1 Tax=Paenibacillus sp. FSL H7-0331 TaxID=1920421 RepID=UPI00096F6CCC|nr:cyclase family protein [Paenibacillus sp. FSL H7-0331]OMF06980.1 cyclase [Paenibacillus sp. FSL H7-0331]
MCDYVHPRQLKPSKSPWGPNDQIGRLNLINAESRNKVFSFIDTSREFDLSVNYFVGMPSWTAAGDPPFQIWMTHTPSGNIVENPMNIDRETNELTSYSGDAFSMYTHCGTHIDTFNHFGYHGEIWNGFNEKEHLGSRHWTKCGPENFPPIIARAVMIDVAAAKGVEMLPDSYGIGKVDLEEALARQGVEIQEGDIVMIRTGRMTVWPDQNKFVNNSPGINVEGAEFLASKGVMIIGADNIALENLPSPESGNWQPVHTYLFSEVGIPILELLWLEELSKEKVYEVGFFGTCMPLVGATGAPIRPAVYPYKQN